MENDLEKSIRLCRELATLLDKNGIKPNKSPTELGEACNAVLDSTAQELLSLPIEAVMFALRTELTINRCIQYWLDEQPQFSLILMKANGNVEISSKKE